MGKDLSIDFAGVTFKNPIVASSGNITMYPHTTKKCIEAGVGGLSTKGIAATITWPLPRPSIWFFDKYGDVGSVGNIEIAWLNIDRGVKFIREIKPLANKENVVIIGNLALVNLDVDAVQDSARKLEEAGADMIEANYGCPIVFYMENVVIDDWEKRQSEMVKILKEAVSIPVILKTSPSRSAKSIKTVEDTKVDGYSYFSIPARGVVIDIESAKPVIRGLPHYAGRGARAFASYATYKFALRTNLPIMSSGGITTTRDSIERLMCGATLAAIHTAVMHRGHKVFTDMVKGLESFMERKGYDSVKDLIGIAMPYIENREELTKFVTEKQVPKETMKLTIDTKKCTSCGICARVCTTGAMTMEGKIPRNNSGLCEFCGICQSLCMVDAITTKHQKVKA